VFMRRYQLMQMCWQDSPGNRASLRELRIMLLHLHSASRGDPDTTSFDQKWNQLMPRQLSSVEDPSISSGHSFVHPVVDVDLGTVSGSSAQPADFLEPNTLANHVLSPETSSSFSANADNSETKSPVNEMSLAAELGGTFQSYHSDNDEDVNVKYMCENVDSSHTTAHISVLAEIHSEKSVAQLADSLNVPLSESVDITDTSVDSSMSQAQKYASYLKTVNTSVIEGDDDAVDEPQSRDLLQSEAAQSNEQDQQ